VSRIDLGVVAIIICAVAFACERLPTAVPQEAMSTALLFSRPSSTRSSAGFIPCQPLPDAVVRQVVGPAGANIEIGPHRLVIPPGALTAAHQIEALIYQDLVRRTTLVKLPTGRAVQVGYSVVNAVSFKPHLKFRRRAALTLSFANCDVLPLESRRATVVYANRMMNVIRDVLPSAVDPDAGTATAEIEHFSNYAVAW